MALTRAGLSPRMRAASGMATGSTIDTTIAQTCYLRQSLCKRNRYVNLWTIPGALEHSNANCVSGRRRGARHGLRGEAGSASNYLVSRNALGGGVRVAKPGA